MSCGRSTRLYVSVLFFLVILHLAAFVLYLALSSPVTDRGNEREGRGSGALVGEGRSEVVVAVEEVSVRRVTDVQVAARTPVAASHTASGQGSTIYHNAGFRVEGGSYPFYVADKRWDSRTRRYEFYRQGMHGAEIRLKTDARWQIQSENQNHYPQPESGCGPTALLNLYLWYSKYGLINETIHHSDAWQYKQLKFRQIDRKIYELRRQSRNRRGGTNTLELIVALEEIMKDSGNQNTRIHFELKDPPLNTNDFLNITRGYRSGILSVRPWDKRRGRLEGNHAVLVIAGDRSGRVTLANWGGYTNGRLVMRGDQQWFLAEREDEPDFLINRLTTLIPFRPTKPRGR